MPAVETIRRSARRTLHTAPLSHQQQSLWFLHTLGDRGAYNELEAVRLVGRLDVGALRSSFEVLVERHELLRTDFLAEEGVPRQHVREPGGFRLPVLDLSLLSAPAREAEIQRIARLDAQRSFDLTEGPLLRVRLVRTAADEHVLLVTIHHLCGDGWSLGILSRELEAIYRARVVGERPKLPELRAQYRDYVSFQRDETPESRRREQLEYWKKQLAGLPPLLDLPLDRARPPITSAEGAAFRAPIGLDLTERLKAFGRKLRATPFMTTLAAFSMLLHRYSRMEDFAIGTPFANRGRSEFEALLGFFANTVVLRADLSGDPSVEELMARVRKTTLGAYEHAELPFERVVEALHPPRDLSYNPVFQVMFSWQPGHTFANMSLPGCQVSSVRAGGTRSKFDINLVLWESATEGIVTRWEYDTTLFDATTIERMASHLRRLLERMIEDPARRISELPLLGDDEQRTMLTRWEARKTFPPDETIHQRFRRVAATHADRTALVHDGRPMTYGELDRRSDALANHLRALGVGPERLVGMFLERSAATIVAILGILKAGGAYVPMDPVYPASRLAGIVNDAGLTALITQTSLLGDLPDVDVPKLLMDRDWAAIEASPPRSGPDARPEDAAYVIYTSGSTGVPKGVLIPHHQVVRLFQATEHWYAFGPNDVWSVFHSFAFDVSVYEIWGGLLYGGKIVIVPYVTSRSPEEFYALLRAEKVTILSQTPTAFQQLNQFEGRIGAAADLALRLIIFAGEALDFNTLAPWFERHGDEVPRLVNMYGITETTVHSTYRPVTLADLRAKSRSMIGEPIPDLELLVLDERLRPVPVGVPGELFVGGAGVARGYLNRPELNAYRFIQRPDDPTRRLYRSGDLVRSHPNGDIEYIGRIDHQVQLRGFRVELGEIEAGLTELPGVHEAVALIREDSPGDKRIVAYGVLRADAPSLDALREHLRKKLPSYMVPAAIVVLESLPLTPNGKLNRGALPKPVYQGNAAVAPRTRTEAVLFDIWSEVLRSSAFGVRDNFFDVGGHSLLAVQVLALVQSRFERKLPVIALFQNPTIEALAAVIEQGAPAWTPLVPLRAQGNEAPLFCLPGSGAMGIALRPLATRLQADRPFVALERPGLDGVKTPLHAVKAMADEAVAAIRSRQPVGPYWLAGHSFGAWIAYEAARQLTEAGERVALLAVLDMPAPPAAPAQSTATADRLLDRLLEILAVTHGFTPAGAREALSGLSLDQQLARLQREMSEANVLGASNALEQVRGMLRVLEADDVALAAWSSNGGASDVPIALIRTDTVWDGSLGARADEADATLGWGRFSTRRTSVRRVKGVHRTMLAPPYVDALAAALDEALREGAP